MAIHQDLDASPGQGTKRLARIAIDRGGTFTDVYCTQPGSADVAFKLLSEDPASYPDAPAEGIRRCLEIVTGQKLPRGQPLVLDSVESIRMGTTVATNALLERRGEKCALLVTEGWRDLLHIGTQARPNIFDLSVARLPMLYSTVAEIAERVTIETSSDDAGSTIEAASDDPALVKGTSGELVRVLKRPDLALVESQLDKLWLEGYRSLALALLHSYTFKTHEEQIAAVARRKGFSVSVSHELQPMIKVVARASSATADAYLSPSIRRYLTTFGQAFKGGIDAFGDKLYFMQSDGGLARWDDFTGLRAIMSGPAGGVVGYSKTCYDEKRKKPLVAVDVGGTSTDVSRYDGRLEHVFESVTAQTTIQAPQLDINTVAAGGGSRLFWRNGMFVVGPESAGAHPGPICYKKGGHLAVSDANLLLGRLLPEHFPKIFGPNEDEPLDVQGTRKAFDDLTALVNQQQGSHLTAEEVALGFLKVATESMCRPVRSLTESKGHEIAGHDLVMFGGAGGQIACATASTLGISRILVPRFSSILSAYGMALADVVCEAQEATFSALNQGSVDDFAARAQALVRSTSSQLRGRGFRGDQIGIEVFYNCRFQGSSTSIMILQEGDDFDFVGRFTEEHRRQYGFVPHERPVIIDDVRVRATGASSSFKSQGAVDELESGPRRSAALGRFRRNKVYFDSLGWTDAVVAPLEDLAPGDELAGPALIYDSTQTLLVEPGYLAVVLSQHVVIDRHVESQPQTALAGTATIDPIMLSLFSNRFMSIAEQMGNMLRQTAISTNIKERLDFSCALFSADGALCANAPNVPVHLGAMSHAVRYQSDRWKGKLRPGDVLVSNTPKSGGSHLPDITVMTPSFRDGDIIFWTASRAHHADIGGIRAGSMPPSSKQLWQEGAQIESFMLVRDGHFDEEGITDLVYHQPARHPGCSGTRTLGDVISDLKAQVTANHRGATLIRALVDQYTLPVVQLYMDAVIANAELAVRNLLRDVSRRFEGQALHATEFMDDGSEIRLRVEIDPGSGDTTMDFSGTSDEVYGNLNAPTAILYSAVIYVLRSMISTSMPLNQGCLKPIQIIVPPSSLLSPSAEAGVVAGNVETSQRITDVLLKAFQACGASQGTCNNLTFGYGGNTSDGVITKGFGYYETICGGAGAGPTWHGQSGVHVHMTNTAIGDVELIERKYPVIIHRFGLRTGSGGDGALRGGDGIVREIEFRKELQVSILSERRVHSPYGMRGGKPGAKGHNYWLRRRSDGSHHRVALGGKNEVTMAAGDRIVIVTPGGGGYGAPLKN